MSIAILGLIAWGLAGPAQSRYKAVIIVIVVLYSVVTLVASYYMASIIGSPRPVYLIGLPSVFSFTIVLLILEWKNIPGTEPEIT